MHELKMPTVLKVDGGKEEGDVEVEVRQVQKDVIKAVLAADLVNSSVSGDLAGAVL